MCTFCLEIGAQRFSLQAVLSFFSFTRVFHADQSVMACPGSYRCLPSVRDDWISEFVDLSAVYHLLSLAVSTSIIGVKM